MNEIETFVENRLMIDGLMKPERFIEKHKLNVKNRKHEVLFVRYYLVLQLRKKTLLTVTKIGEMFNMSHSSVSVGLRTCNNLIDTKNEKFTEIVSVFKNEIDNLNYENIH